MKNMKMNKILPLMILCCGPLLTACGSGSIIDVSNPTYVYITNSDNSYSQCLVNDNGIESDSCTTIKPNGSNALSGPTGIAFNGKFAYINNFDTDSYTQCLVSANGIESYSCTIVAPTGNGVLELPTGIAFNGEFAYILNYTGSYTQCSVSANGIEPYTCVTTELSGSLDFPTGIAFNGKFAYITNSGYGSGRSYTQCMVTDEGIKSDTCKVVVPHGDGALSTPMAIAFNGKFAYITNSGSGDGTSYTQCLVGDNGIESDTCIGVTPVGIGALSAPVGIAFSGEFAYIVNSETNSYTQCLVGVNGIKSSTCKTIIPSGSSALKDPYYIAFH